jgi:hypothetical protein
MVRALALVAAPVEPAEALVVRVWLQPGLVAQVLEAEAVQRVRPVGTRI